ncbi:C40 family peptidase [Ralstonia sp. 1138]|uniref:C40 family peptidase n=1 Tax=Ralstonia sp. 1138 TaxID=3156423 RepID=UPI0033934162
MVAMAVLILSIPAWCRAEYINPTDFDEPLAASDLVDGGAIALALERLRSQALELVGIRYRYGGTTPKSGFDCSGFVQYVIRHAAGLNLGRTAASMATEGQQVKRDALRVGDLVFFNTLGAVYSHVGIYLGRGQFVHAPSTGGRVRIENLENPYWYVRYTGARRLFK